MKCPLRLYQKVIEVVGEAGLGKPFKLVDEVALKMEFLQVFAVHFEQGSYRNDLVMSYLYVALPSLNFSRTGACNLASDSMLAILLTSFV